MLEVLFRSGQAVLPGRMHPTRIAEIRWRWIATATQTTLREGSVDGVASKPIAMKRTRRVYQTGLECPEFGGLRVVARILWRRATAKRIALQELMPEPGRIR